MSNPIFTQLVQDLRQWLEHEGLQPVIDTNLPVGKQYIRLQEMAFNDIARCRQQDAALRESEQH